MHGNKDRLPLALLLLGALLLPLRAEKVEEVPNPRQASGSWVSDAGRVLAPEYVRMIDSVCRELQARTGAELAVVTVGDLGGLVIEDFAVRLFRRFAIGAAGRDNGLLLLCSRDDRQVRLEVGYGLEGEIPDLRASRLLEQGALTHLGAGRFGRGLFTAARDIAAAAAAAGGAELSIPEPASWPEEAKPPLPLASAPVPKKRAAWDPVGSSLRFASGLLGFAMLGLGWTRWRFHNTRGLAARRKVIDQGWVPTVLTWVGAVASFFLVFGFGKEFFPPFASMLSAPGLATIAQVLNRGFLRKRLASYRLPCPACAKPMEMVDDSRDDSCMNEAEAAEEKAGGMDYEFWNCPACGAREKLAVKLNKASACPACKRRTLVSSRATLVEATPEQGGRTRITETCLNPRCGFRRTREESTPRLSSPGSSSGSHHASPPSFGGGRSGGGGASKGF